MPLGNEHSFVKSRTEIVIGGFPFYFSHTIIATGLGEINGNGIIIWIIRDLPVGETTTDSTVKHGFHLYLDFYQNVYNNNKCKTLLHTLLSLKYYSRIDTCTVHLNII